MADKLTLEQFQKLIPGLSSWKIAIAKKHAVQRGRGAEVISSHTPRIKLDISQVEHFLTFITSGHVVQDLPFGEKVLKLSTGKV